MGIGVRVNLDSLNGKKQKAEAEDVHLSPEFEKLCMFLFMLCTSLPLL